MASTSTGIEWTDATWNPVTGCTKVSPGCQHCYAERIAERFGGPGSFATVRTHPGRLDHPARWRAPRRIFVNSMSDLFHPAVPEAFIGSVWDVMASTPRHTYQILTKRPARARALLRRWEQAGWTWRRHDGLWCGPVAWPLPNVWVGTSAESQKWADLRLPALLSTPAAVRFLSAEPLLGPIELDRHLFPRGCPAGCGCRWPNDADYRDCGCGGPCCAGDWHPVPALDWVIAGGESGPGARPMYPGWPGYLREECAVAGVPFFFKQWGNWRPARPDDGPGGPGRTVCVSPGGRTEHCPDPDPLRCYPDALMRRVGKHDAGRVLDGRTWDEFPAGAA